MLKRSIIALSILVGLLSACNQNTVEKVSLETVKKEINNYKGKLIETEGTVIHICGVDLKKLKLKSDSGIIVKLVPANADEEFDKKLNKKRVRVTGKLLENIVPKSYIDKMEREKRLLCHVDHKPCKDAAWVKHKEESGVADSMAAKDIKKLRNKMDETGTDYVSVLIIEANKIEIIEE